MNALKFVGLYIPGVNRMRSSVIEHNMLGMSAQGGVMANPIKNEILNYCVIGVFIALIAAGAMTTANRVISQRPNPEPLDVAKWKAGAGIPVHLGWQADKVPLPFPGRYAMALGLIESSKLIGMDENEVVRLLGRPETMNHGVLAYRIPDLPLTVADAYLYVVIENGRVARCKLQEIN